MSSRFVASIYTETHIEERLLCVRVCVCVCLEIPRIFRPVVKACRCVT